MMRFNKYALGLLASVAFVATGCQNADIDNEHHYDNKLYISSEKVVSDLLIKADVQTASRTVSYQLAQPLEEDVLLQFEAKPSLVAEYNLAYDDKASALPEECYDIPETDATIKAGAVSGSIEVNFKNINELDRKRRYVLPVTLANVFGIDVLASKRTTYFVFKGAALVNVVADLTSGVRFKVEKWNNDDALYKMDQITAEMLIRPHELKRMISTLMGIEDKFLIRIGDSGLDPNQIQLATSSGNVTDASWKIPELDKWVHIALTYNSSNSEVELYMDGVKKGGTKKASYKQTVTWSTSSFYIGYSYAMGREFNGDVSEFRVWNRVLTEEEIQSPDHFYYVDPASEGLVAYWKFDDAAGDQVKDHTANGNHLIASGSPDGTLKWVNVELPE